MNDTRTTAGRYWATNPRATPGAPYGEAEAAVLDAEGAAAAHAFISSWPGYAPTPLLSLPDIARVAGVAEVRYKDESHRFGLSSFKPLGGAYAVARATLRSLAASGDPAEPADLVAGRYRERAAGITVTAATDGNHGRAVAWGARRFGCRAVIFIHETVSPGREHAIAALGAEVRRTPGTYDDAVRTASATAAAEGWVVIPDTSDGIVVDAPRDVMHGYTVMAGEAVAQLADGPIPTHVFLQCGVGGMAAAVCAGLWQAYSGRRPRVVLVEPENAACWLESLRAGTPVTVTGDLDSVMAGLACGEVSRLAWPILERGADAMMRVGDEAAAACMRLLAQPAPDRAALVAGESAVAGLAGLLEAAQDSSARDALGLGADSRVLLFGTEGATDPATYEKLVGRSPDEVMA